MIDFVLYLMWQQILETVTGGLGIISHADLIEN